MTKTEQEDVKMLHEEIVEARRLRAELETRVQGFFALCAEEMRRPHFGEHAKGVLGALLLRAQESNLYRPEATNG